MLPQTDRLLDASRNALLPAIVFAIAAIGLCLRLDLPASSLQSLHAAALACALAALALLAAANSDRGLFAVLALAAGYLFANHLRQKYGAAAALNPAFAALGVIVAANLLASAFLPAGRMFRRQAAGLLLVLCLELALLEKIETLPALAALPIPPGAAAGAAIALLAALLVKSAASGAMIDAALFYAALGVCLAALSGSAGPAPALFFFAAAVAAVGLGIAAELYKSRYCDALDGLPSAQAFARDEKGFPLKYSLGLLSLDDCPGLAAAFGRKGAERLLKMVSLLVSAIAAETGTGIYRAAGPDEFVLVFREKDRNEAFALLDAIRREVASAEFMAARRQAVKLTVSGSVAEKKRSDAGAQDTLARARKALLKTYKFTQNVVSKA